VSHSENKVVAVVGPDQVVVGADAPDPIEVQSDSLGHGSSQDLLAAGVSSPEVSLVGQPENKVDTVDTG